MNGKEKSYTMTRIKGIAEEKVIAICMEKPFPCQNYELEQPPSRSHPSDEHFRQAMRKVGVKMMTPADFLKRFDSDDRSRGISFTSYARNLIANYSQIEKEAVRIERADKTSRPNVLIEKARRVKKIRDRVVEICDQLLLGSAEDAMTLINKFAAEKF